MAYKNKEDQARAARRHYLKNSEKIKQRARQFNIKAVNRNREFVKNAKQNPCTDCGIRYAAHIMQFDHIGNNKKDNIANLVNQAVSINTIKKEIEKCELVCANCHADRTYKRKNSL